MTWLLSILGIKKWAAWASIAGLFLLLLGAVALTFWMKGRASRAVDILNAQIRERTRELEIKDAQLQDAANRPNDDELDELLDNGKF